LNIAIKNTLQSMNSFIRNYLANSNIFGIIFFLKVRILILTLFF